MGGFVLRTTDVPKGERFDWWVDLVTRDLAPTHITTEHRDDFRATATALALGPVTVSTLSFPTLQSWRTSRLIRLSDPELWELAYVTRGLMGIEQARSRAQLQAGDLLLYDTSRPFESRVTVDGRITILHLPKTAVPLADRSMRDLLSRPLPAHDSSALLAGFLQGLASGSWSGWEAEQIGTAAVHLTSAFLTGLADREGLLPPETRHTVLLYRVKAFIQAHLSDPDLSPPVVAEAHSISVRYLHHLFRQEKQTISAFIRQRRLERCQTDLTAPGLATRPVGAIGARWGFTDEAVFSRAFKTTYGVPPGEYRRRASLGTGRTVT
ncbi:helix-turn-helix domain-containing protein [Kitasatospora sp. NPDC101155]|uniref:helix-turn-helix domain-containing protein n=1 Tax=Kitasatospora sp. NPDC101155 TaxID=3364097 RepID=UPI003805B8D3